MEEEHNKDLTLIQRIQLIAQEVKSIGKDMTVKLNDYKSYKAVSDLSVTTCVKDAEYKYGVISIPINQQIANSEVITAKAGTIYYSIYIEMKVRFYNIDDCEDYIDIISFGHGLDSGDKAFGKASTYARKYALLNAYKIATGEDPDNEPSKEVKQKQEPKKSSKPNFPSKSQDEEKFNQVVNLLRVGSVNSTTGDIRKFTLADVERKYYLSEEVKNELVDAVLFQEANS